jgi:ABC-type transport system involved in multi-copper enzyme maturation permease subunit
MIWLAWRQFRTQAVVTLAVLAAATVYLLITGVAMHHVYNLDLVACRQPDARCGLILDTFTRTYDSQRQLFQLLVISAPAVIGIFWGAPLISSEFERGTHRMAWNQSLTPTRWLAVKLAVVGLAAIVTAAVLSLLLTWWASPIDQAAGDRFSAFVFATRNLVPVGYAAFSFAAGTLFGFLTRRAVVAMAVTVALFVVLQVVFGTVVRTNLLPSTTRLVTVSADLFDQAHGVGAGPNPDGPITVVAPEPPGAWLKSETNLENAAGQDISGSLVSGCLDKPPTSPRGMGQCLAAYDLHFSYTYEPGRDYWPLQWYETGIYVVLAGLLVAACFWRIRRHHD